ncbi:MAG: hypothetical protein QXR85_02990 [Candidatus Micrarchaeaceae archaeon]
MSNAEKNGRIGEKGKATMAKQALPLKREAPNKQTRWKPGL